MLTYANSFAHSCVFFLQEQVPVHLPRFQVGYGGASKAVGVVFWKKRDERCQRTNRTICELRLSVETQTRKTSSVDEAPDPWTPDNL